MSALKPMLALAALLLLSMSVVGAANDLDTVRERLKIEAQRLEQEFADERAAAYKLVRQDNPNLDAALEKLRNLLTTVRADTSLDARRREVLIVTLKSDLDRVRGIAGERRRQSLRENETALGRVVATESRAATQAERTEATRRLANDTRSALETRNTMLADARSERIRAQDRYARVLRSVEESAVPEHREVTFPKNWVELSKKRIVTVKMTAKEKAIMNALKTTISVDFDKATLEEVINYLRTISKVEILADRRALQEASVTYDTPISLKANTSMRTVLKRILADLNLAYVIKDETIQITSRERAKEMTTTRSYYIGDLALVTDYTVPLGLSHLAMMEQVNQIINMITKNIDEESWKVNNPEAVGTITFDPQTMSIVVKQTAEIHYILGGFR